MHGITPAAGRGYPENTGHSDRVPGPVVDSAVCAKLGWRDRASRVRDARGRFGLQ